MRSQKNPGFRKRMWAVFSLISLLAWTGFGFQEEKQSRQPQGGSKNSPVVRTIPRSATSFAQQDEFRRLLEEGKRLFEEEMDFDAAVSCYKQAVDLASTTSLRAQAYFLMSLVHFASTSEDDLTGFQGTLAKIFENNYAYSPEERLCPPKYLERFRQMQAQYGALHFRSDPPGAEIYLNDETISVGITPLTVGLKKGAVKLRIKKGKREKKDLLNVVGGKKLEVPVYVLKGKSPLPFILGGIATAGGISAALLLKGKNGSAGNGASPTAGSIQITSTPTGANIYLDGSDTGQATNFTLSDIPPGSHVIKLLKEGYVDHQENISVAAGGTAILNVTLTPHHITVSRPASNTVWTTGEEGRIEWQNSTQSSAIRHNSARTSSTANLRSFARFRAGNRLSRGFATAHRNSAARTIRPYIRTHYTSQKTSPGMTAPILFKKSIGESPLEIAPVSTGNIGTTTTQKDTQSAFAASSAFPGLIRPAQSFSGKPRPQAISEIKIDLYRGTSLQSPIAANTSNSGTYSWTVDSSLATGNNYKVRVSCFSDPEIFGESAYFTIQKQTTNNLAPNPSFENGTVFPNSWVSTISNGLADVTWSMQKSHHGSRSIRIANPQSADLSYSASMGVETSNFINVDTSRIYDFSAWYLYAQKPEPTSSSTVIIFIEEYDASGKWLQAYGDTGHGSDAQENIWYQFTWSRAFNSLTAKIKLSVVYLCEERQENTVLFFDDLSFTRR